jgi:bacterioferritin
MQHEAAALSLYKELLDVVAGRSVMLEEYARQMIHAEELHTGEVDKMLRRPGEISTSGLGLTGDVAGQLRGQCGDRARGNLY